MVSLKDIASIYMLVWWQLHPCLIFSKICLHEFLDESHDVFGCLHLSVELGEFAVLSVADPDFCWINIQLSKLCILVRPNLKPICKILAYIILTFHVLWILFLQLFFYDVSSLLVLFLIRAHVELNAILFRQIDSFLFYCLWSLSSYLCCLCIDNAWRQ